MSIKFTDPTRLKAVLPWVITVVLLLTFSFAAVTGNRMGGFVNGFLISGAAMVLVSLFLGRKTISRAELG